MRGQKGDDGRRAALLDSARELFDRQGYAGTTMSAIQQAAGASTGSLYHHFPSKAHIAATLQAEALVDYQSRVMQVLEDGGGRWQTPDDTGDAAEGERVIRAVVATHLQWIDENPQSARLLYAVDDPAVAQLLEARLQTINRDFFPRVQEWYALRVSGGSLREVPSAVLPSVWIGPAQELARSHFQRAKRSGASDRANREMADGGPDTADHARGPGLSRFSAALGEAAWRALRADG